MAGAPRRQLDTTEQAQGSGGSRHPPSHPQLWQGQRPQQAQAGEAAPLLSLPMGHLSFSPLDKTPSPGAGTYLKG